MTSKVEMETVYKGHDSEDEVTFATIVLTQPQAIAAAAHVIHSGQWIEVRPLASGEYQVRVEESQAHLLPGEVQA